MSQRERNTAVPHGPVILNHLDCGDGPALVLLHGWGCDLHDWDAFVPTAAVDHRAISVDLRGHGCSPQPISGYGLRTLTADVAALMNSVTPEGAVLIGHSLGGAIASVLAVEYPQLVHALVLVDPAYGRPPGHDEHIRQLLASPATGRELCQRLQASSIDAMTSAQRDVHLRRLEAMANDVLDAVLAGLWLEDGNIVIRPGADRYLARRRCPLLAIHSDRDRAEWERGLLRHPASAAMFWPGVTHFLHLNEPRMFAATALDWIRQLPATEPIGEPISVEVQARPSHGSSIAAAKEPTIDVHLHLGRTVTRVPAVEQTVRGALELMDACGIEAAIASAAGGDELSGGLRSVQARNNALAALVQEHPARFPLALADADPRIGLELAAAEARRAIEDLGLAGVCLIPAMSATAVGPPLRSIFHELDLRGSICLLHPTPGCGLEIGDLLDEFREVRLIIAHAPMWTEDPRVLQRLAEHDHVWFDTSQNTASPEPRRLSRLIETVGHERVVFAGDSPYYSLPDALCILQLAVPDPAAREAVAYLNAAQLINDHITRRTQRGVEAR